MTPLSSDLPNAHAGRRFWPWQVAAVLPLLTGTACGPASGSNENGASVIDLRAADIHAVATSDLLALVEDLEVHPDGSVWVLNSAEPLLVHFGRDGDVLAAYGQLGGGPDEFGAPAGFVEGGIGGLTWIVDVPRHVLREVAGPDGSRQVIPLPEETLPRGSVVGTNPFRLTVRTALAGDEVLIPRRSGDLDEPVTGIWIGMWHADIVGVHVESSIGREVLSLAATLGDPFDHFDTEGSGLPFPLWYRLWTVCSGDELRVHDRLRNEIRRFTTDGSELEAFPLPPVALTDVSTRQFATAMFDVAAAERMGSIPRGGILTSPEDSVRILNEFIPRLTAGGSRLAGLLPRYVDLRCDSAGTQWLQPFDTDAPGPAFGGLRGGRVWLRTRADGRTDRVRMPDRFDPYRFTPDRIWGVHRDELDVATVAWIEVQ